MLKKIKRTAAKLLNTQQKVYQEIGHTAKRVLEKHTPYGIGKSAMGLDRDKTALKKSKAGLAKVRTRAANRLRQVNIQRRDMVKREKNNILSPSHISSIKQSKSLTDAQKNSLFERDMRLRQRLRLPQ